MSLSDLRMSDQERRDPLLKKISIPQPENGEYFIAPPVCLDWIIRGCNLRGSGFKMAMSYRFLTDKYQGPSRHPLAEVASGLKLSENTARAGLLLAEAAGLIEVDRNPGCRLVISIPEASRIRSLPPGFNLSVPWWWWFPCSQLSNYCLRTGAFIWVAANQRGSGRFLLDRSSARQFRLPRQILTRGLNQLREANLISIDVGDGGAWFVTISTKRRGQ